MGEEHTAASCTAQEGQYLPRASRSVFSSWRHPALQTAHPPPPTSRVGTPSKSPPRELPGVTADSASPLLTQLAHSPQYLGRKTLPIKRGDAEPLTREDLQYDLLYYIFADRTVAFVDFLAPGKPLVNFCDLYVNALYNSSKCSKVLKDKMVETPAFAIEFAKISLLTNVGRINTTMACQSNLLIRTVTSTFGTVSDRHLLSSFPGNEDRLAQLSSGPISPED